MGEEFRAHHLLTYGMFSQFLTEIIVRFPFAALFSRTPECHFRFWRVPESPDRGGPCVGRREDEASARLGLGQERCAQWSEVFNSPRN